MLKPYIRKVNYYETDQMKVVHHSNYARYIEEARLDLMEQSGIDYKAMEDEGTIIPVLEINTKFKYAVHFGDTIAIDIKVNKLTPVRFSLEYKIKDAETGEIRCEATSTHAFVNDKFMPFNIKKSFPEVYAQFEALLSKDE